MKSGVGLRGVLALLCLLASFAYSARAVMSMDASVAASHAMPVAQDHSEHTASQHAASQHATPSSSPSSSPESKHAHAAHCPFCFTSSFALEGQTYLLPALLESIQLEEKAVRVHTRGVQNPTHHARGPPTLPVV